MDKKLKQRRQKIPTKEELAEINLMPPGASFDTEEGRRAQGMRRDLGGPADEWPADMNVPPLAPDAAKRPANYGGAA